MPASRKEYMRRDEESEPHTYYFNTNDLEGLHLDRLIRAINAGGKVHNSVFALGHGGSAMVKLGDGDYYSVVRTGDHAFELKPYK
ncbi:MAG: hypothetical protein ABIG66_00475 [Candidatus Kerfeldbacteria bacterium]